MSEASLLRPNVPHNHRHCIDAAIRQAEDICKTRGLRFTAHRRRVLELVWDSHKPVGAYDILEKLVQDGRKTAPPTVYRALDFLLEAQLIHRLDSLNAFIGCPDPVEAHNGQFLICGSCKLVAELGDNEIEQMIEVKAGGRGFTSLTQNIEVHGLCSDCKSNA